MCHIRKPRKGTIFFHILQLICGLLRKVIDQKRNLTYYIRSFSTCISRKRCHHLSRDLLFWLRHLIIWSTAFGNDFQFAFSPPKKNKYMLKVNNSNTKWWWEMCSKVNNKDMYHTFLNVFHNFFLLLLLVLNR